MSVVLRNSPTYALVDSESTVYLRNVPVYALVDDPPLLPKNILGKDAVLAMIKKLAREQLDWAKVSLGSPAVAQATDTNTSVVLSATPELISYQGSTPFVYNRVPLVQEISRVAELLSLSGISNSHELIPEINRASGLLLAQSDLELTQVANGKLVLRAAVTSYFFIPGSETTLG